MEGLVTDPLFWSGKKVFLTGHTGFKGAWASLLLRRLGASVYGYALPPTHQSALFVTARIADDIKHRVADIRDLAALRAAMAEAEPDIVIHMAAQALVRPSYEEPVETFATNFMGTVHVLEAARPLACVQVILNVTSDKCYENNGTGTAFREGDRLGGDDPYSNSKACAELVRIPIATASSTRREQPASLARAPATFSAAAISRATAWCRTRCRRSWRARRCASAIPIRCGPGSTRSTRCSVILSWSSGWRAMNVSPEAGISGPMPRAKCRSGPWSIA